MSRSFLVLFVLLAGCAAEAQTCPPEDVVPLPDELTATPLGDTVDADSWQSESTAFGDCQPQRVFRFHGKDTSLTKKNDPTVELLTKDLHVCLFVACDVGATRIRECTGQETEAYYAESALGTRGCCAPDRDTLTVEYFCQDSVSSLISDDSAELYVQICPAKPITENNFSFRYHF